VIVTAYRISKQNFSGTIWAGAGAREFGGRWNSRGVAVIYAAESRSLAAMEQLVHLIKLRILSGYVVASIQFDSRLLQRLNPLALPTRWNNSVAPSALKQFGDDWAAAAKYPVLAVPSAVISGEWNYLFNPGHPKFRAMVKSTPEPFAYDRRLK
jgi:RES domain-containing protein